MGQIVLPMLVGWISQERWDALTDEQRGAFPNICPDFVV